MIYIGIDVGTHTGFAVWDSGERKLLSLDTLLIHQAMEQVLHWYYKCDGDIMVIVEEARLRKWYGAKSDAKLQGAGSVKRDSSIWEDFLKDKGIPFQGIHPLQGLTKLTSVYFKRITKWEGKTSEHSRDAAMLVIGKR